MSVPTSGGAPARIRTPRSVEAGLLVLAGLIVAAAFVLVSLGRSRALPADLVPLLVGVFVLFAAAHIGVRRLAPRADALLLPSAVLLNGLGYVFIMRLDPDLGAQQAGWTAVGVVGFIGVLAVIRRVRTLEGLRFTVGLVGVILLILPLLPGLGVTIYGARIWVRAGPISFQPGEFAKLALAIFFAGYLVERRELLGTATFKVGPFMIPEPKHLVPVVLAWGTSLVVMVFERDLGSALLFFALFMSVLWIASGRISYVAIGSMLFAVGAVFAWNSFGHVRTRVDVWLNPWDDVLDSGYQIAQATYAFAWGGVTGVGFGQGFGNRVPVAESDFIFAIMGEELGLLGTTAVIVLFLTIIGSGFRIAMRSTNPFNKLLAVGLTTLIGFQSFIIMAGVTRLLPLTGLTLPFVSYGGSSLVSNWMLIALLLRLSDEAETREAQRVAEDDRAADLGLTTTIGVGV
ncbi:MAG TPA: FtsW/RodA/SpoVE family cell cycle protein [Microthrixaceae bacterium]|nr:FtsW/RodA/SpoVE family cell cycle protein [Microthrixaceae bacterium]